jgi:hypothetical protein
MGMSDKSEVGAGHMTKYELAKKIVDAVYAANQRTNQYLRGDK